MADVFISTLPERKSPGSVVLVSGPIFAPTAGHFRAPSRVLFLFEEVPFGLRGSSNGNPGLSAILLRLDLHASRGLVDHASGQLRDAAAVLDGQLEIIAGEGSLDGDEV